jgi:TolB protein
MPHPPGRPDGRTIAFRSERTGNSEIWTVVSDRGEERQLTQTPGGDYAPAFSADGRWLAFSSSRGGGALQLWRMRANGEAPERLNQLSTASPAWSRDGERLYFAPTDGPARLWALSLKDRRERVVADLTHRYGSLGIQAPATDGLSLFFSWRSDVGDIWVTDVAGE